MDEKNLFNAINYAAEEFAPEVWESTEGERPIVLRAVKKPHGWIRTALASAAAVLVVGAAVAVGANIYSQRGTFLPNSASNTNSGDGDIERNFAPLTDDIVRIRDVGFYSNNPSFDDIGYIPEGELYLIGFMPNTGAADGFSGGGSMEGLPGLDFIEYLKDWYKDPKPREFFYSNTAVGFIPPRPDIYYFNDLPLDSRMLSDEANDWLYRYCLLSEEDRKIEAVPEYVKHLAGGGFMRYGDVGFLCDKYTEVQRKYIRECMETEPYPVYSSMKLPQPDVYYYEDIPYHLDRAYTDDARNWLRWFCFLDKETQSLLNGYVPEEMTGTITECNAEKREEIVTYKGREIDVRSVSYDTELFIKWYNTLSSELQAKVGYEPEELHRGQVIDYSGTELPIEVYGPDGKRLTYGDLTDAKMFEDGFYTQNLTINDLAQCESIELYDIVYLAEPGTTEFKKYHIGDEICGLTIVEATSWFEKYDENDTVLHYSHGCVRFEGEVIVDAYVRKMGNSYQAVMSGELPLIALDNEQYDHGIIVPKAYGIPDDLSSLTGPDYYGDLYGENDRLYNNQYTVLHDVRLENVTMKWYRTDYAAIEYQFSADLCYEQGNSSAYDWADSIDTIPVDPLFSVATVHWQVSRDLSGWDLETLKSEMFFLKESLLLTEYGAEAYSVADGEIYAADSDPDRGNYVVVKHGEKLYTVYSHLCDDKEILVKVGDKVSAGQLIGYAGMSGQIPINESYSGGVLGYKFCVDF